jgi:8-oxo-dGTP pyrophosphatase MutT (NUDIX family)
MTLPRQVARGLVFDENGRILLVHWRDPVGGREFLEPPGGRHEPGESLEEAVRREVAEETGVVGVEVHGSVAELHKVFTFAGADYHSHEHYFVCTASGTEARIPARDPLEQAGIVGVEWVPLDDLAGYPDGYLEPPELLEMLRRLGRF